MKKKCPDGKYYCYTDKVCKDIPKGFKVVGPAGMLLRRMVTLLMMILKPRMVRRMGMAMVIQMAMAMVVL